jgi:hypothetical protein
MRFSRAFGDWRQIRWIELRPPKSCSTYQDGAR